MLNRVPLKTHNHPKTMLKPLRQVRNEFSPKNSPSLATYAMLYAATSLPSSATLTSSTPLSLAVSMSSKSSVQSMASAATPKRAQQSATAKMNAPVYR